MILEGQGRFAKAVADWAGMPDDPVIHAEWRGALGAPTKGRERATERIAKQLSQEGVDEYALGMDPVSNVVRLTVPQRAGRRVDELTSMAREAVVAAVGEPLSVVVDFTSSHPVPTHRGGETYLLGGGPGHCTGGFSVANSDVVGISTAAHCSPKPSYYDGSIVGSTPAGADRDVRWTRVYGAKSAKFRYSSGNSYYTVNSSRNPAIGEAVGRYGAAPGANSGTVGISSGYYNGRDYLSGVGSLNLLNMIVVTA